MIFLIISVGIAIASWYTGNMGILAVAWGVSMLGAIHEIKISRDYCKALTDEILKLSKR